jgi:hypothetical protein
MFWRSECQQPTKGLNLECYLIMNIFVLKLRNPGQQLGRRYAHIEVDPLEFRRDSVVKRIWYI